MHVMILGSGVIGTTTAYYLARAGHQVTVVDRQPGPALRTSYANAGEVSPGYSAPWAGPASRSRRSVDADAPQPARDLADARRGDVALGRADAAQLHRGPLPRQQGAHGAPGGVQPRLHGAAARGDAHRLRRAHAGHAAALSHPEAARRRGQGHRDPAAVRRRLRGARPRGISCRRAGARRGRAQVRRRCACRRRTGDCFKFTNNLAAMVSSLGVAFRQDTSIEAVVAEGGRIAGVRTRSGTLRGPTRISPRSAATSPRMVAPLGLALPVYPVRATRSRCRSPTSASRPSRRSWTRRTRSR